MKTYSMTLVMSLVLLSSLFFSQTANAKDWRAYEPKAFAAMQEADKTVLVDIKASWCPTCKKQEKILNALLTYPEFKDVEVFYLDFDEEKEALKDFKADSQSTIIVFKGKKEIQRSVGVTDQDALKKMIESGL